MIEKILCNARTIVLFTALIVVAGLSSLNQLPRTEDPELATRFASVSTQYPGADAERVESQLTEPLERALRTRKVVKNIDSNTSFGFSSIVIELQSYLKPDELGDAWSEIQDEIDLFDTRLPAGASSSVLEKERFPGFTLVFGLTLDAMDSEENLVLLSRIAKDLESQLLSVPGTVFVDTVGDAGEEILVELDMTKVITSGLTVEEIGRRIADSDTKLSAGSISGGQHRFALEVDESFEDLERLRRIPVILDQSGVLLLGDVATVKRMPVTPLPAYALISGERGLAVGARMNASLRSDLWSARLLEHVDEYKQTLPSNVNLDLIFNQDDYTSDRLNTLAANVFIGFSLILLVLLVSLGWRSALIVASSLPLTMLFSMAAMRFFDGSINQMSVTGLIIALGIMVDNAIVMADTVARYRCSGLSPIEAQIKSVKRLWIPLMGSTLTTVFAFLPLVLQPGSVGEFVSGLGIAVIFSLVGSFFISQIFVAGLAARFLKVNEGNTRWFVTGLRIKWLARTLRRTVLLAMRRPRLAIVLLVTPSLIGMYGIGKVPTEFFPPSDRDMINIEVFMPVSNNIASTSAVVDRVNKLLSEDKEVDSLHWFVGSNAPKVYYNLIYGADGAQHYAQAIIRMTDLRVANRKVSELQQVFDQRFPEAQFIVRRFQQGPLFAPIEVRVFGDDIDTLAGLGEQMKARLLSLSGVTHSQTSISQGEPKALISADEIILQSIGLTMRDATSQTLAVTDGIVQAQLQEDTETLPIRVRASYYKDDTGILIPDTPIQGRLQEDGELYSTPLSALASVNYVPVRNAITRRNGQRMNNVTAFLEDGVLPSQVLEVFKRSLQEDPIDIPQGYSIGYGGEAEERDNAVGSLLATVGIIIVLIVTSIVMAFNSFRLTALILFVGSLSAGLGMISLIISGYPFGFTTILGVMAMIGLAINAAIVILAECRSNAQACSGDVDAVAHSVLHCSRHITSTTITTIVGFLPLLIAGGGFWPPFAIVVAGGTLLTTVLSLLLVPVLFALFARRRAFRVTGGDS